MKNKHNARQMHDVMSPFHPSLLPLNPDGVRTLRKQTTALLGEARAVQLALLPFLGVPNASVSEKEKPNGRK